MIDKGAKVTSLYLHPEDSIKSKENYVRYHNNAGAITMHQFEGRVQHKNKKWVWILTREIVFKRNAEGKPLQVLGSALDITLRKEMEQSLVYKTMQLQQSNVNLEEFAHVSSHDLQEPLRKISTFADRLLISH
ncbi:MAG: PAS domain-containing protein [Chitinophagaceae bacterium]|nr:PAS domain-containing protein [Chitinophagaceae bacterium]